MGSGLKSFSIVIGGLVAFALGGVVLAAPPTETTASTAVRAPTFNRDVAPIIFANCSSCHHEGEVAPFPLMSYADVKKHAKEIVDLTGDRQMPPWKAAPNYGHFAGERRLTDDQIATIASWSKAGQPEGDAADLPATPKFSTGWEHGQPDMIVKMPKPFMLPSEGKDVFRVFVIPLNLDHDVY